MQEALSLAVVNRLQSHTTVSGSPARLAQMLARVGGDVAVPLPIGVPFHHPRWARTKLVDDILAKVLLFRWMHAILGLGECSVGHPLAVR